MKIIAEPSRDKLFWTAAFLGGGSIYILLQPIWEPGGLEALIAGRDAGRHWWPIAAVAALVVIPMMARSLLRTLRRPTPSFAVIDGQLQHYAWKENLPVEDVVGVAFRPGNLLLGRASSLTLELKGGAVRDVPTFLLRGDGHQIARAISEVLELEPTPLS